MNRLVEHRWHDKKNIGPLPCQNYRKGQECHIALFAGIYDYIIEYYSSDKVMIIEDVGNGTYVVEPSQSIDRLAVSHWDLIPVDYLVETKSFLPLNLVRPGAVVKFIKEKVVCVVKEAVGNDMKLANGSVVDGNMLVEIMLTFDQAHLSESFVRY